MSNKHEDLLNHWSVLIKEAYDSGENIKTWLERQGITRSQFYYWAKQVRDSELPSTDLGPVSSPESSAPSSPGPVIAEIHISDPWDTGDAKSLFSPEIMVMKNGYQVYVGNHFFPETLRNVMEVLNKC